MPSNIAAPLQWWDYNRDDPASDGLVAAWPMWEGMGGEAQDVVNGFHGALTNMDPATDWVATERGWALDFDNTKTKYVDLGINLFGMGIRRHATIILQVAFADTGTVTSEIFGDWNNSQGLAARGNFGEDNVLTVFVYPGNHRINATVTIADDEWVSIAAVMDGANMFLYFNGDEVGTQTLGEDIGDSAATAKIGTRGDLSNPVHGQIGSTHIHSRALSPSEIQEQFVDPMGIFRRLDRSGVLPPPAPGAGILPQITSAYYRTNA